MTVKWYRGYAVYGNPDDYVKKICGLVRQNGLGDIIHHLLIGQLFKGQLYIFVGFDTSSKGYIPDQAKWLLDSITLGPPAGNFDYKEIENMVSREVDCTLPFRTLAYRPPVITPAEDPLDLSELETYADQQPTNEAILTLNRLLYWLSATGAGGWQLFRRVYNLLTAETVSLDARYIFRRLRLLGHVEYVAANGSKWSVCPPVLVQGSQPDSYFLAGQRTPKLLARLTELAEVETQPQPTGEAPDLVQLRFPSTEAARQAVSSGQVGLRWAGCASMRLAQVLPDLAGYQASLSPVSGFALSNFKLEQWQGQAYVETYFQQQTGLYRLTPHDDNVRLSSQALFFDAVTSQWRAGPWYDLRYLAQQTADDPCQVKYHSAQRWLAIPANYRWPDLYERALVLASGLLPRSPDKRWFYFSDISPNLAQTLTAKLNATLEEVA